MKDFFLYGFIGKYLTENELSSKISITLICISAFLCIVIPYLLGSFNFAIIISGKQYRQDIRSYGSGNAGMTNMMRTYGKRAAGLTLLGDAIKAVISCLIGYALIGQYGSYIAGLFCIVGHMFPLYYHFKGGKGVVTAGIAILMCNPIVFAILFLLFAAIVIVTKYISLGSVMCMLLYPIVLDRIERSRLFYLDPPEACPYVIFAFLMTVLVVFKHRENIQRLLKGQENKFSFKKSVKVSDNSNSPIPEEEEKKEN